jgi:TPP-dependent 2-oxoacid decarboxylase
MIRVADYIVERLAEYGIGHVFIVTGGTAMHLNACLWKSIRNQEGFLLP